MKELYYVNGNKNGFTWKQLLYWCYTCININNKPSYWHNGYNRPINEPHDVNDFFSSFGNNPNDGYYENGYWETRVIKTFYHVVVGPMRFNEDHIKLAKIYGRVWIPPTFTPKKYQVTDSYGRTIPSGYIKNEYYKYIPNSNDKQVIPSSYYYYSCRKWNSNHIRQEFRKDPVPFTGGRRHGWWRKSKGKHAGRAAMKRQWFRDEIYSKEILYEYGITFKMDRREFHHNHHHGNCGRGWKRTRKKKQWM